MELKEGMYVRFNNGSIQKINHVDERNNPLFDLNIDGNLHSTFDIQKASHNIIDLIEVGDYVNGDLVLFAGATTWDNDGNVLVKQVHINHNGYDWWLTEDLIKSIVTKEQFESISYKVGE